MAYTQTPGRGNKAKTGAGLPASLNSGSTTNTTIDPTKKVQLSEKAITSIESIGAENKLKLAIESQAKQDSSMVARKSLRSNVYKRAQEGSEAGNKTRREGGVPEVMRFSNPHMYGTYETRTGERDTYFRNAPVEKDFKKVGLNKKTNEIDTK